MIFREIDLPAERISFKNRQIEPMFLSFFDELLSIQNLNVSRINRSNDKWDFVYDFQTPCWFW